MPRKKSAKKKARAAVKKIGKTVKQTAKAVKRLVAEKRHQYRSISLY